MIDHEPRAVLQAGNLTDGYGPYAAPAGECVSEPCSGTAGCCTMVGCCECPSDAQRCCAESFWNHGSGFFGEFMFLSARDVDIPYATPVDGLGPTGVSVGQTSVVDPDHEPGFRVGGSLALDWRSSFSATYTHFESNTGDQVNLPGGTGFLRAELVGPNTQNVASDSLSASGNYDIDFQLGDFNYSAVLRGGCDYVLNYLVGVRYGRLDQDYQSTYAILGATTVDSNIDFYGIGPRFGLNGERLIRGGLLVYARSSASFLVGEFEAQYTQTNAVIGPQTAAGFQDDRLVSQLELELGLGWQTKCGRFRASAGYYISAWANTLTVPTWINAVQRNDMDEVDETLVFDGLTARAEVRF